MTEASFDGPDCDAARDGHQACSALSADLPVDVGAALDHCPIDFDGNPATDGVPCVQVRVLPNLMPVAGSPTVFMKSMWPKAWPVSASDVSRNRPPISG